jgi:hypothetical protein
VEILMAVVAVSFGLASAIHLGLVISLGGLTIRDLFLGAAVPEGIIAGALVVAVTGVVMRLSVRWYITLGASLFAAALTVYGLSITARSSRTGDVAYHVVVLVVLGITVAILLLPGARRDLKA